MAMTGHSSEAVFLKYICHDKEEKANSAADNQFLNNRIWQVTLII